MRPQSRTTILAAAILGLIGLACWLTGAFGGVIAAGRESSADEASRHGTDTAGAGTRVEIPATTVGSPPESGPADTGSPAELVLRVRNADGSPVAGIVAWSTSADPAVCGRAMPMFAGTAKDGVRQESFTGNVSLEVRSRAWTWVKVVRRENPVRAWYRRVAPFAGRRVEDMLIEDEARAVHVFVWNAAITGPAARREVSIYATDMTSGTPPTVLQRITTDEHGYAVARGLRAGRYFIAGPGSGLRDVHPRCAQLILPAGMPFAEATCVVVARPRGVPVKVRVIAKLEGGRSTKVAPKLFLARVDDGSRTTYPLHGVIVDGRTDLTTEVPPGSYEPGVLPIGALVLERAERFLQVEAGKPNVLTIRATRDPASTRLAIAGIEPKYLPITVHPRRCDVGVVADDDRLFFLGDYRWRTPELYVPALPYRCQLVVSGRGRVFLSAPGVEVSGSRVVVNVAPASRIQVRWTGARSAGCPEASLTAKREGDADELVTRMHRALVRRGTELVPAFVASVVVPPGRVTLECRSPDGGVTWARQLVVAKALETLDVAQD